MLNAKLYDLRGIIPQPGEDLHSYLTRASRDLNDLESCRRDIRLRTGNIKFPWSPRLEQIVGQGEYEPLEILSVPDYGFSKVPIPVIAIEGDIYNKIFYENVVSVHTKSGARNIPVLYRERELPLTVVYRPILEVDLNEVGIDSSQYGDASHIFEMFAKHALEENRKDKVIGHETIHGVRRLSDLISSSPDLHFEELVAYSMPPEEARVKILKDYFSSRHIALNGVMLFRPFNSVRLLRQYFYLRQRVEDGTTEKIPLPLLVRISYKEFRDIAERLEAGREVRTIVAKKSNDRSTDSWRWKLIAELCGF